MLCRVKCGYFSTACSFAGNVKVYLTLLIVCQAFTQSCYWAVQQQMVCVLSCFLVCRTERGIIWSQSNTCSLLLYHGMTLVFLTGSIVSWLQCKILAQVLIGLNQASSPWNFLLSFMQPICCKVSRISFWRELGPNINCIGVFRYSSIRYAYFF